MADSQLLLWGIQGFGYPGGSLKTFELPLATE